MTARVAPRAAASRRHPRVEPSKNLGRGGYLPATASRGPGRPAPKPIEPRTRGIVRVTGIDDDGRHAA
jgi:hypothetical protein